MNTLAELGLRSQQSKMRAKQGRADCVRPRACLDCLLKGALQGQHAGPAPNPWRVQQPLIQLLVGTQQTSFPNQPCSTSTPHATIADSALLRADLGLASRAGCGPRLHSATTSRPLPAAHALPPDRSPTTPPTQPSTPQAGAWQGPGSGPGLSNPQSSGSVTQPQPPQQEGATSTSDGMSATGAAQPDDQKGLETEKAQQEAGEDDSLPVRLALGMLAFYRGAISPLMPSSCRYQPTCSNYSIQSYKMFGVWRGSVLTAWRLLRCSPFGSSGYDPPMWPPPGLGLLYGTGTWEYSPQVTVFVGAVFLAWLANALWTEISYIL